jgi:hypothetical protein
MPRLIARFLLLATLVGNLGPLALASIAPPPACCVRKAVHHCHDFQVSETGRLFIRNAENCNHNCCRALTTARWAYAQPHPDAGFAQNDAAYLGQFSPIYPDSGAFAFQSTRAPPHFFLA